MPGHIATTVNNRAAGFLGYRQLFQPYALAQKRSVEAFCLPWANSFRKERLQERDMGSGCNIL